MKSAIYIEDGVTQIALTPENEWEKNALKMINSSANVQSFWGGFYECRGGWFRHNAENYPQDSLMFRIDKKTEVHELPENHGFGYVGIP